jgi:uncharacterized protein YqfB (UPF0267 family)
MEGPVDQSHSTCGYQRKTSQLLEINDIIDAEYPQEKGFYVKNHNLGANK